MYKVDHLSLSMIKLQSLLTKLNRHVFYDSSDGVHALHIRSILKYISTVYFAICGAVVPKHFCMEPFHTISKIMEPLSNLRHIILKNYLKTTYMPLMGRMQLFLDIRILWTFGLILDNEALWNHKPCFMEPNGSAEPIWNHWCRALMVRWHGMKGELTVGGV